MNALLLAKKNPYPDHDGEAIAIMQMAKGLADNGCDVHILCMNTPKHNFAAGDIPVSITNKITIETVWVDAAITMTGAFANLFKRTPYHVERFHSDAFEKALIGILQEQTIDIVQCEGLFVAQYLPLIRKYSKAKAIYRSHNVEGAIWERFSAYQQKGLKNIYLKMQWQKLYAYEKMVSAEFDAVVPISAADAVWYQQYVPGSKIKFSPTGIQSEKMIAIDSNTIDHNSVYFLGGLDWLPNQQGLTWFVDEVFPEVLAGYPHAVFHIAGRNAPADFGRLANDHIVFHGAVADAADFVKDKFICVVPLLSGSGMKIKIAEAMAAGRLVVTTPVGVEGMPDGMAEHLLVANDAEEFSKQIIWALANREAAMQKAAKGREYVKYTLDNTRLVKELIQFYTGL